MALIPLKDIATITKSGGLDDWGQPIPGAATEYKCRINEGTKLTRSKGGNGTNVSNEVISDTQILFDKAVSISYDDDITWTDSAGIPRTSKPLSIRVIKDISSKPLLTEVDL